MKPLLLSIRLTLLTVFLVPMTTNAFAQCSIGFAFVTEPSCVGLCNGSVYASAINGTPPYTYLWNPSGQTTQTASGLCAGNYICVVTDANLDTCSGSTVVPSPTPFVATVNTDSATCPTCCDGSVHASCLPVSSGPYRFKLTSTPFQYSGDFYNVCAGSDTLCISDFKGCITCIPFSINPITTFVEKIQKNFSINITPNPFFNKLSFSFADYEQITVSLYNFLGQQVLQQVFTNSMTINTEHLAVGIYFFELRNNKGILKTGKVVKQ